MGTVQDAVGLLEAVFSLSRPYMADALGRAERWMGRDLILIDRSDYTKQPGRP